MQEHGCRVKTQTDGSIIFNTPAKKAATVQHFFVIIWTLFMQTERGCEDGLLWRLSTSQENNVDVIRGHHWSGFPPRKNINHPGQQKMIF